MWVRAGDWPVRIAVREGVQTGAAAYASEKRSPRAARRSRLGVLHGALPYGARHVPLSAWHCMARAVHCLPPQLHPASIGTDVSCCPRSSTKMSTMFGRAAPTPCFASASPATSTSLELAVVHESCANNENVHTNTAITNRKHFSKRTPRSTREECGAFGRIDMARVSRGEALATTPDSLMSAKLVNFAVT